MRAYTNDESSSVVDSGDQPVELAKTRRTTAASSWQLGSLAAMLAVVVWAYWPTLLLLFSKWENDPQYAHGYLVPVFALVLLFVRRSQYHPSFPSTSWTGLGALAAGLGLFLSGAYFYLEWFQHLSVVPVAFGICLLAGGVAAVRWAWPSLLSLSFMLPLPYSLEVALRDPLRRVGTVASTYIMQTVGLPAFAEGNIINVGDVQIGVVEACSGLSMLMVFFALSTAVAMLSERPIWERLLIVISAVPIAIISNVVRITVTAGLHVGLHDRVVFGMSGTDLADRVFHDWAGWLMMPLALALLWLELWILSHLFIIEEDQPMMMGLDTGAKSSTSTA